VLRRWLADSGSQHVHAHFGTNSTMVALLCRMLGGPPYSFTVHGPEELDKPEALSLTEKIGAAAFVVAISSFGRSQLYRWCRVDQWPKIRVVRCGVDETYIDAESTPVPDVTRLVCVGRLCEQKGQQLLVEAIGRLVAGGVDVELVLAGDGEMRPEVEQAIATHGVTRQVRITGWVDSDQIVDELRAARALVLPSFAEGLPVVIMEALALGRPVLTTYIAGIPELVTPEVNGWLVPAGSVDALVGALRELLATDSATLTEMGARGRERVLEAHDAKKSAAFLAQLFAGGDG
jgi:glycosyltransferase involved in cell wall biosynthesis